MKKNILILCLFITIVFIALFTSNFNKGDIEVDPYFMDYHNGKISYMTSETEKVLVSILNSRLDPVSGYEKNIYDAVIEIGSTDEKIKITIKKDKGSSEVYISMRRGFRNNIYLYNDEDDFFDFLPYH